MALWLLKPLLVNYVDRKNIEYLQKHQCDTTLYTLIRKAVRQSCAVRIEGSVKISKDKEEMGRYTVSLTIPQWNSFLPTDKEDILNCIGFTLVDIAKILAENQEVDDYTDLILGTASKKLGKIYLDFGSRIVCYETSGRVKYYNGTKDTLIMHTENETSKHQRTHKDLSFKGYPVYWTALNDSQSNTYYTRPVSTILLELTDLVS